jgi:hypothetical protein
MKSISDMSGILIYGIDYDDTCLHGGHILGRRWRELLQFAHEQRQPLLWQRGQAYWLYSYCSPLCEVGLTA